MISDYHTHSYFSSDCDAIPEDNIKKAIELGMTEICFTDHVDFDYPDENGQPQFRIDASAYFAELNELKMKYANNIKIKIGIETGLNPATYEPNSQLIDSHFFDFIIGSSHIVDSIDPYYKEYWEGISAHDGIMKYYEAILHNVTMNNNYDVYGHLDYIRRYVIDKEYVYIDDDFYDITDMILKNIIAKGHGIELNTRALSKGLTTFVPTITLLKRYHDLGGEIITVGSDAHLTGKIGYAFLTAKDILLNTGFKYVSTFENRVPSFIAIE